MKSTSDPKSIDFSGEFSHLFTQTHHNSSDTEIIKQSWKVNICIICLSGICQEVVVKPLSVRTLCGRLFEHVHTCAANVLFMVSLLIRQTKPCAMLNAAQCTHKTLLRVRQVMPIVYVE